MHTFSSKKNTLAEKGFTLIEMMVSLTIFSIVMLISTGTLLIMIDINAKAQALYSSSTNLAFAIDNMTRELRTGYRYYCINVTGTQDALPSQSDVRDCTETTPSTAGNFISYTREKDGWQVAYRLNNSKIEQKINNPTGSTGDTDWIPITSDDVVVENFSFTVTGTDPYYKNPLIPSDTAQPSVDLFIKGYVNNGLESNTDFNIQTRIIQRRLDLI